ncbi:LmeA family phospholipid-binding protein [Cellulomonas edaphi]|uniref:DUF2993 domain-containing protein n=1 Tax=Cellulomonas edaphi TaxID=3053468 RepID=A0ABT7S3Q0_9CELL|nr:DUF2993 domain-containing protein [Cellulomons edaphi]MDM7830246.1 DUF2993 domain-containing protein [Cellulomons edaphi]
MSARGVVIGLVVAVAVVGGGAVVADRWAANETEDRAVERIGQELDDVVGTPTVDVGDFPFLTQVARGSLDGITAHVPGATLNGLALTDIDLAATGVSTSEPYTAERARVEATIAPEQIQKAVTERTSLDLTVTSQGDTLKVAGTVLGVALTATVEPRVEDGRLLADVTGMALGGLAVDPDDLPGNLGDRVQGIEIPVEDLPEGLVLTDAQVGDGGLRITAAGTDVTLTAAS